MKPKGMIPFVQQKLSTSRKPSHKSSRSQQLDTSDSQNTSVNIMRRLSTFQSTKSNFTGKSQDQYSTNTIEMEGEIELDRIQQTVCLVAELMYYEKEITGKGKVVLIKREDSVWGKLCACCFGGRASRGCVIAVEVKRRVVSGKKVLVMKLVEGNFSTFKEFEIVVEEKLKHILPKSSLSTLSSGISNASQGYSGGSSGVIDIMMTGSIGDSPFNMERKAYVAVEKILKKNYIPVVSKLKQNIKGMKSKVLSKSLPQNQLINQLLRTVNKIYQQIYTSLNIYNFDIIYYSIQKFVCSYVLPLIQQIYKEKLQKQQSVFQTKRHKILTQWSDTDIIKYLQIKPQFQLLPQNSTDPSYIPYSLAINKLSELSNNLSLRQKMRIVQQYYSALKVSCYQFHKGKLQIATMDDILPVIIMTVLKSDVKNFYSELKMVDDYARACGRFEGDQRILTNLFVGLEYVSKQWVLN